MTYDNTNQPVEKKPAAIQTVLVTGSQGFIGTYICADLLQRGYQVIGIDDYSKYGKVVRPHDGHDNFDFIEGKVESILHILNHLRFKDTGDAPNYIIHLAAKIGGIAYFHKYAYDLLSDNEKINTAVFDYAVSLQTCEKIDFKRFMYFSSSMVFESASVFPTKESHITACPPPLSTYGASKLIGEYFCKGAGEQYGLPYTIIRPFNCVGVGEDDKLSGTETPDGNEKMMLSHVLPDLVYRAIKIGEEAELTILGSGNQVRHYTNGRDIARGTIMAMEDANAGGEAFNISHKHPVSVLQLVSVVYECLYGFGVFPPSIKHAKGFEYDVQHRSPDVSKAHEMLGFSADISLRESVLEVCEWMKKRIHEEE